MLLTLTNTNYCELLIPTRESLEARSIYYCGMRKYGYWTEQKKQQQEI